MLLEFKPAPKEIDEEEVMEKLAEEKLKQTKTFWSQVFGFEEGAL